MFGSGKDDSLFRRFDNVLQQMEQDGWLVVRATLQERQLYTSSVSYDIFIKIFPHQFHSTFHAKEDKDWQAIWVAQSRYDNHD